VRPLRVSCSPCCSTRSRSSPLYLVVELALLLVVHEQRAQVGHEMSIARRHTARPEQQHAVLVPRRRSRRRCATTRRTSRGLCGLLHCGGSRRSGRGLCLCRRHGVAVVEARGTRNKKNERTRSDGQESKSCPGIFVLFGVRMIDR